MRCFSMTDIITANKVRGMYFFSPNTMRFFRSRKNYPAYNGPGGIYFVTSEKFDDDSPRLYTVRKFDPETADIDTVGEFQGYKSRNGAHRAAERFANQV